MKEFNVLGVTIKDYPLKELLQLASDHLNTPGVKTMSWISANVLLYVSEDPVQREWVDDLDLMVCDQAGLLKSGRAASQLHKDGKSEDFIANYLNYLGSNGSTIAIVCDNEERKKNFERFIKEHNDRLKIIDYLLISDVEMMDDLFNQLNEEAPRLVFTCVPWELQGPILEAARRMSNSSLWVSFLPEMLDEIAGTRVGKREAFIERFMFGRRVASYERGIK